MKEIWKDIPEWEGLYQVSNLGNVKSLDHYIEYEYNGIRCRRFKKGCILIPTIRSDNVHVVGLHRNGGVETKSIHRLVMLTFEPDKSNFMYSPNDDLSKINLDELEVNHKDENRYNNTLENLEWCTHLYNIEYGTRNYRCIHCNDKFLKPISAYTKNGEYVRTYRGVREAARDLNGDHSFIARIAGKEDKTAYSYKWKFVE